MKKVILILTITTLFFSCNRQDKVIDSVKVWYYNGIFERAAAVSCDEIIYQPEKVDTLDVALEDVNSLPKQAVILEALITDKEVLQEIAGELEQASSDDSFAIDARAKCFIQYADGSTDTICLSEQFTYGYCNGEPKSFTNKFAYLIRKNCGFYWWIRADYMKHFEELNDTTFAREKVKSRWGGEY